MGKLNGKIRKYPGFALPLSARAPHVAQFYTLTPGYIPPEESVPYHKQNLKTLALV